MDAVGYCSRNSFIYVFFSVLLCHKMIWHIHSITAALTFSGLLFTSNDYNSCLASYVLSPHSWKKNIFFFRWPKPNVTAPAHVEGTHQTPINYYEEIYSSTRASHSYWHFDGSKLKRNHQLFGSVMILCRSAGAFFQFVIRSNYAQLIELMSIHYIVFVLGESWFCGSDDVTDH